MLRSENIKSFRLAPPRMSPSWSSGDFSVQLAAVAQVFYDDNILQDNLDRLGDMRFSLDPSVHLRWDPSTAPAGTSAQRAGWPGSLVAVFLVFSGVVFFQAGVVAPPEGNIFDTLDLNALVAILR